MFKHNFVKLLVATSFLAGASCAMADDVHITAVQEKGGFTRVAFDLNTAGNAVGLNFKLVVPGLDESSAKVSACVSELPKGWTGGCSSLKGGIYVFATSESITPLPAGVTPVGSVTFRANQSLAKAGEALRVEELFVSDTTGMGIESSAKITAE
jgi:hypothetical protein